MIDFKKQLGKRIKYIRKKMGLSQEQLSEKIDITPRSLGNVETGRFFISLKNLEKLIEVFNIEPYELFVFDKEPIDDIIFDDVVKKLEKFKHNKKRLYAISAFLDNIS